jgi:hypothetical protein
MFVCGYLLLSYLGVVSIFVNVKRDDIVLTTTAVSITLLVVLIIWTDPVFGSMANV